MKREQTVLFVEGNADYAALVTRRLRKRAGPLDMVHVASVQAAIVELASATFDCLIVDTALPDGDGLDAVRWLRGRDRQVPFVVLTADETSGTSLRARRLGAREYVVKGPMAIEAVASFLGALRVADDDSGEGQLVGHSPVMRRVRSLAGRFGPSRACVRIEGETGVGKELAARSVHAASPRSGGAFVAVNCGALPENLAEAELFGHVRGAFTGADRDRQGLVDRAQGGTLFLDEIEDLPLSVQGTLLRLIEEDEYRPVGSALCSEADVRIIAASNRDLSGMVESGEFRRDLFYRLDVLPLFLPALRERIEDLPVLIDHLLRRGRGASGRREAFATNARPHDADLERLARHPWPGNVRELSNVVERVRVLATHAGWRRAWERAIDDLFAAAQRVEGSVARVDAYVEPSERELLERILSRHRWRRDRTASEMGISRVTLWRRMQRLGISTARRRSPECREPPGATPEAGSEECA